MFTILFASIIGFSIPYLVKFIGLGDAISSLLIAAFDLGFFVLLILIGIKGLIPALLGKIALELNDDGLVNYLKNVTVPWNAIESIDFRSSQSSSSLYVKFKWETDNGSHMRIPLQMIKGKDMDIYDTIEAYYRKQR